MLRKLILQALIPIGMLTGLAGLEAIPVDPNNLPKIVFTKKDLDKIEPGYIFVDSLIGGFYGGQGGSYLVDIEGNIVKFFPIGGFSKFLPNGHLLAGYYFPNTIFPQPYLDSLVETDWDGNVVWPPGAALLTGPDGFSKLADPRAQVVALLKDPLGRWITGMHHDFERKHNPVGYYAPGQRPILGGGKTLILNNSFPPLEKTVNISPYPLYNDKIYEVKVDEKTHVLWSWDPVDHFEPKRGHKGDLGLGFSTIARAALQLFQVPVFLVDTDQTDWLHSNTAVYLGKNKWYGDGDCSCHSRHSDPRFHPDNVLWNSREANITAIIARHDRPGHWKSGDIIWRIGPEYPNETIPGKLDRLIGPHFPHIIPEGLPGAGNILVFDNGGAAGYGADENGDPAIDVESRPYSRVIEFNPITLDIVWLYERPNTDFPPVFFSAFVSNAQRLKNGNTLICEGFSGRVFEVTPSGETVLEFYNPFTGPPFGGNGIYRAFWVPEHWVPINSSSED